MSQAPFHLTVRSATPGRPGVRLCSLDLTLRNPGEVPAWYLMPRDLHHHPQERITADLVHACGFEGHPDLFYLQVIGRGAGLVGFLLDADATLRLNGFRYRADAGAEAIPIWRVPALEVEGQPIEALFRRPFLIRGEEEVLAAQQRTTRSTWERREVVVSMRPPLETWLAAL